MKSQKQKKRRSPGLADKSVDRKCLFAEAWEIFVGFLKSRNDRITQTRRIVLERALDRHDHFRADDLASNLARGADRVSRGTVYRTLTLLVQAGLVREIRDTDAHAHFEPVFGREHHEHMVCDECGKFIEFVDTGMEGHISRACEKQKFTQRTHRVIIFGLCSECQ